MVDQDNPKVPRLLTRPRPPSRPEFFLGSRIALDLGISPEQVRRRCGTPAAFVYGQTRVPLWSVSQVEALRRRLSRERGHR
jgi:hypothetical protein